MLANFTKESLFTFPQIFFHQFKHLFFCLVISLKHLAFFVEDIEVTILSKTYNCLPSKYFLCVHGVCSHICICFSFL